MWHWSVSVLTHADTLYRKNGNQFVLRAEFMIYWWIVASNCFFPLAGNMLLLSTIAKSIWTALNLSFAHVFGNPAKMTCILTLFRKHVRRNMWTAVEESDHHSNVLWVFWFEVYAAVVGNTLVYSCIPILETYSSFLGYSPQLIFQMKQTESYHPHAECDWNLPSILSLQHIIQRH